MKNLVPVLVILLLLGVGGYYFMNSQKSKPPAVEQKAAGSREQGSNIFSSIKDALSKSVSLKCDYPDPSGKGTITSYIKNGAVRMSSINMGPQGNGSAIMKDNKMWIWDDTKKEGMVLTLNPPEADKTNKSAPKEDQREKVLAEMEKYKSYCKTEVVSDSLFTPPAGVKFTDLENIMKQVPSVNVPTQAEEPNQ